MKIGVISDTHDQHENILKTVKILNEKRVELTIHCGDWISPFVIQFFRGLQCPMKGVFGNNDGDRFMHLIRAKDSKVKVQIEERVLKVEIDNRKIFVYHGDYEDVTEALVLSSKYNAVFHGHTHISVNKTIGETLSLNPGTLMPFTNDEVQGASFAIYETKSNTAELIKL